MQTATRIARSADLKAGDRVTEIDTPEGPFYEVLKVNAKSIVLNAAHPDDTEPYPLRLAFRPTDAVLVAV